MKRPTSKHNSPPGNFPSSFEKKGRLLVSFATVQDLVHSIMWFSTFVSFLIVAVSLCRASSSLGPPPFSAPFRAPPIPRSVSFYSIPISEYGNSVITHGSGGFDENTITNTSMVDVTIVVNVTDGKQISSTLTSSTFSLHTGPLIQLGTAAKSSTSPINASASITDPGTANRTFLSSENAVRTAPPLTSGAQTLKTLPTRAESSTSFSENPSSRDSSVITLIASPYSSSVDTAAQSTPSASIAPRANNDPIGEYRDVELRQGPTSMPKAKREEPTFAPRQYGDLDEPTLKARDNTGRDNEVMNAYVAATPDPLPSLGLGSLVGGKSIGSEVISSTTKSTGNIRFGQAAGITATFDNPTIITAPPNRRDLHPESDVESFAGQVGSGVGSIGDKVTSAAGPVISDAKSAEAMVSSVVVSFGSAVISQGEALASTVEVRPQTHTPAASGACARSALFLPWPLLLVVLCMFSAVSGTFVLPNTSSPGASIPTGAPEAPSLVTQLLLLFHLPLALQSLRICLLLPSLLLHVPLLVFHFEFHPCLHPLPRLLLKRIRRQFCSIRGIQTQLTRKQPRFKYYWYRSVRTICLLIPGGISLGFAASRWAHIHQIPPKVRTTYPVVPMPDLDIKSTHLAISRREGLRAMRALLCELNVEHDTWEKYDDICPHPAGERPRGPSKKQKRKGGEGKPVPKRGGGGVCANNCSAAPALRIVGRESSMSWGVGA